MLGQVNLFGKKTTPPYGHPSLKKEGSMLCANFVVTISCLHRKYATAGLVNLKWKVYRLPLGAMCNRSDFSRHKRKVPVGGVVLNDKNQPIQVKIKLAL